MPRVVIGQDRRGDHCLHVTTDDGTMIVTVWQTSSDLEKAKEQAWAALELAMLRLLDKEKTD